MITTNVEHIGTLGAKRQTGSSANPRAELRRLIAEHPDIGESQMYAICWDHFITHDAYEEKPGHFYRTIFEYWFANNYRSIVLESPNSIGRRVEAKRRARTIEDNVSSAVASGIKSAVNRGIRIALLDMIMPNGKPLRACSGEECLAISGDLGSFLTEIGAGLKPQQLVGEVYNEDKLIEIYERSI